MNASKFILLAGLFAIITAEFSFAQNTPTPTATVEPDIKSFKELATRFPTRSKSGKTVYDFDYVTFDVKKTDSLMNPVIGIINFLTKMTLPNSPSQQKVFGPTDTSYWQMQLEFHWQGDHWKFERLVYPKDGSFNRDPKDLGDAMADFLKSVQ